jgi:hypothetical protein
MGGGTTGGRTMGGGTSGTWTRLFLLS